MAWAAASSRCLSAGPDVIVARLFFPSRSTCMTWIWERFTYLHLCIFGGRGNQRHWLQGSMILEKKYTILKKEMDQAREAQGGT